MCWLLYFPLVSSHRPNLLWGRAVLGHGAHVTHLVQFHQLPSVLWCLFSPTSLFFPLSLIFTSFLCLHDPVLHRETLTVCLDIIALILGLFNGSGSSSESYSFNAEENLVVSHSLEIPPWVCWRGIQFLTLTLWSRASRTVGQLRSQVWEIIDCNGFLYIQLPNNTDSMNGDTWVYNICK